MKITSNFIHICDYASVSQPGSKVNILGIFKNIQSLQAPPIQHPQLFIALNVTCDEVGTYQPIVKMVSDEDIEIARQEFPHVVVSNPGAEVGSIIQFTNLKFPNFGEYKIIAMNGDEEIVTTKLTIKSVQSQ